MAKRPFLLLYINDFLSAVTVTVMDNDQFAWYLRLLMRAWQNEPACCLPNEDYLLMTMAGVKDTPKNKRVWDKKKKLVLSNFTLDSTGIWLRNKKLDDEYLKMVKVAETKAEAGRKSAAAREHKRTEGQQPSTSVEQNSTTQMSDVIRQTKEESKPSASQAKTDSRFKPVKEFVEKCCDHAKVPFTWDGSESSHLSRWLKANPALEADAVVALVRARFRSGAPPGERPRKWIGDLGKYATESRNGNHGGISKQDERTSKSRTAITNVLSEVARRDGAVPQGGSERGNGEGLVRGPKPLLGSGDP